MLVSERASDWAGPSQDLKWGSAVKGGHSYAFHIFVKLLDGGATSYQFRTAMNIELQAGTGVDINFPTAFGPIADVTRASSIVSRTAVDVHLMMSSTSVSAEDGWRRLYGDITMPGDYGDTVSRVWLHVGGVPATVGFLVDGAYLEELPRDSWRAEADARIEQIRKRDVILRINTDSPESVEVEGIHRWPDTVIEMLEDQGVPIRGHCIFWANPERVPWWLNWLSWLDWIWSIVRYMSWQRVDDVVGRYAGRLAHWDVNNEMLHHSYFMDTTGGPQIRYDMFHWAKEKDPNVRRIIH
ncbi:Hypp1272 [Branchiostoma lanceolatum]|uniref:Hypp1272 protein n=1 Tax=Branchiostoma lanceolatum TaxID=7740 RepID=A0A8J9ZFY9_BRALA|nr:Hypp1272 [Branchiostoma lanceolatum]